MSRIGKQPIEISSSVKVEKAGSAVKVTGSLGSLQMRCHPLIDVKINGSAGRITVENKEPGSRKARELHGTMRALIANMVEGVSRGFTKKMQIYGTGFNIKAQGDKLVLQVGFCHPVEIRIPKGIKVDVAVAATRGNDTPAEFTLTGIDKCRLGQFAAEIRRIRPPEPYKGKGIRYAAEHVARKVGKAFASGAA